MNNEYNFKFINIFKHLHVVNKHRLLVFYYCCLAGQPWRGLVHDLSKYSPTEFFESVKYFSGNHSPISNCKRVNGYSKAWLHHFGRNKHHFEYWYDPTAPIPCPIIPFQYVVEMICDSLSAGKVYQGKEWTSEYQLNYWLKSREYAKINPKLDILLTKVYTDISRKGIKEVIKKDNLKKLYDRYTR